MWRRSDFPGISIDIRGEDQLAISWLDVPFIRVKAHEFLQPESDFGRPHGLVGYTPGCTSRQPGWGWTQSSNPSPQAPHASSTQHCQTFYATMWCPNFKFKQSNFELTTFSLKSKHDTRPILEPHAKKFSPTCRHVIERGFDWRRANRLKNANASANATRACCFRPEERGRGHSGTWTWLRHVKDGPPCPLI